MHYHTAFDSMQLGLQWTGCFGAFMGGALFFLIGFAIPPTTNPGLDIRPWGFRIIGSVAMLFSMVFLAGSITEYRDTRKAIETHTYTVVEGVVENFVPIPPGGHAKESFDVNGMHFEYSGRWGSIVFDSNRNIGIIRDGVQARISHIGQDIVKIEVK